MLDNRGEETEDAKEYKTQSKNQGGVKVFGAWAHSRFYQNIPQFGDAKSEADQRQAGADPRHEGAVSRLPAALFSEFVGNIRLPRIFIHLHVFSLWDQTGQRPQAHQAIDQILCRQGRLQHGHHPSKDFLHHRGAALDNHLDVEQGDQVQPHDHQQCR